MYEVGAVIFRSYLSMLYIRIDVCHLSLASTRNFATDMAGVENVEEMVGTREAAVLATESGGAVATEPGGAVATEPGGAATTGDETLVTAGDETAATGEVMYADEGPYTIDVRHVEEMVETTREAADGDRVRRELDGDKTGTRPAVPGTRPATRRQRRLVTKKTVATGGVMYTDEGELEFDEDEMAALEGQHLFAEFRCGIY